MTKVYTEIANLQDIIALEKSSGKKVGFVPTMGALHDGHIRLVREAKKMCNITVMSIFVNPTQFNDKSDLLKYPRTIEADTSLVSKAGLDYLYIPLEEEVYPKDFETKLDLDLGQLDKVMEGQFRPGHFDGVCQVVKRLLDLVQPTHLFMGQKDFQQFTIIDYMISKLNLPVQLVVIPTNRTKTGLARSSRNVRLSDRGRVRASVIYRTLITLKKQIKIRSIEDLQVYATNRLSKAGFTPEYVSIISGTTLQPINNLNNQPYVVVCLAAWLEGVRLIDNMILVDERNEFNKI